MNEYIYENESYQIIGAAYEVYNEMGPDFLEPVYQECLEIELSLQEIPFNRQKELSMEYKDQPLQQTYIADLVCFEHIILELKAVEQLTADHEAQLLNYLNIANVELGLLLNFGASDGLAVKRIAN